MVIEIERPSVSEIVRNQVALFVEGATGPFSRTEVEMQILKVPSIALLRAELRKYPLINAEPLLVSAIHEQTHQRLRSMRDKYGTRTVEAVYSGGVWFWYPVKMLTLPMLIELIAYTQDRIYELQEKHHMYVRIRDRMAQVNAATVSEVYESVMESMKAEQKE